MSKYKNQKTQVYGIWMDSKKEAERLMALMDMEVRGEIHGLKNHVEDKDELTFVLQEGFTDRKGKKYRPITYTADFSYYKNGHHIVEDVKGVKTQVFRIKEKLFRYNYPGITLKIV